MEYLSFCSIDGHYFPNYRSNVAVTSDGTVQWVPPFIFKSGCDTNPHYFPFDVRARNLIYSACKEVAIFMRHKNSEASRRCFDDRVKFKIEHKETLIRLKVRSSVGLLTNLDDLFSN